MGAIVQVMGLCEGNLIIKCLGRKKKKERKKGVLHAPLRKANRSTM